MEDQRTSFGERLRTLSRARGLDSDEDAARLVGVSYRQYQRWLSGESEPRGASLKLIAAAFNVPIGELVDVPSEGQFEKIEAALTALDVKLSAVLVQLEARGMEERRPPGEGQQPARAPQPPPPR